MKKAEEKENYSFKEHWEISDHDNHSIASNDVGGNIYSFVGSDSSSRSWETPLKRKLLNSMRKSASIELSQSKLKNEWCNNSASDNKEDQWWINHELLRLEIIRLESQVEELTLKHRDKDNTIMQLVELLDQTTEGEFKKLLS